MSEAAQIRAKGEIASQMLEDLGKVADLKEENKKLKSVICGMLPMWIAAMSFSEHGRATELSAMHDYYKNGNLMTQDEMTLMFSLIPDSHSSVAEELDRR